METGIVGSIIGLFCTVVSSIVTFILTRRKYNSEVDAQQIENMEKSFDLYKKMMEDTLASQKKMLETTINIQNKKIEALERENESLRNQVHTLQQQLITYLGYNNPTHNNIHGTDIR